ncbi:molybdopterin biosynthesis MoaE protein [Beutenbergia cavernae DSM 12333]|uniref:Molybdopterin biosynthesis MoaE protein n=1 Tax=Beutenbergia cavernae (strain ATCC BAA-8 / DSM 12333 / CCUG 43141 / JCM 11478 / NBRC 16432 / NCIMB 13614 / HKI 0122) TaxID=471853 RepID=C5C436_BEUC1|nr:molybdenum cofactor biosynthesis protein MoaE [Beutenbergia cavernae]ACQ79949.1 molybdopterin biosynthesis MoaE protein [Beutenbergia cavernae DSM 12333]
MSEPSAVVLARIAPAPIDAGEVRDAVASPDCGAVVEFAGVVRDHDGGRGVLRLDYSAHPDAARLLAECCARVAAEFDGVRLAAVHATGELRIGDLALAAAVAAPHRAQAFAAAARLVDAIKAEVPIWKRQHYADGDSGWVGL